MVASPSSAGRHPRVSARRSALLLRWGAPSTNTGRGTGRPGKVDIGDVLSVEVSVSWSADDSIASVMSSASQDTSVQSQARAKPPANPS